MRGDKDCPDLPEVQKVGTKPVSFFLLLPFRQCADPDPLDSNVFGPPGSGSLSQSTDPDQDTSIIEQEP